MTQSTTLIVGVGAAQGIGFQTAQKFANQGHNVILASRNAAQLEAQAKAWGGQAITLDATDPKAVDVMFAGLGSLDCVVHNVGANARKTFDDMDAEFFEQMWRTNSLSTFNVACAAARKLSTQGHGSILFTSASAATRGKPGFAAFASTRGGNRLMIQALAKELGPQNIHVAQVIVDGVVNGQRAMDRWPQVVEKLGQDGALDPAAVADAFWYLHTQQRSAWTHELDLRPFKETF